MAIRESASRSGIEDRGWDVGIDIEIGIEIGIPEGVLYLPYLLTRFKTVLYSKQVPLREGIEERGWRMEERGTRIGSRIEDRGESTIDHRNPVN